MAAPVGLWGTAFPAGGTYGAKGWVPRETVWARVALFVALFMSVWCLLRLALLTIYGAAEKIRGVSPGAWALKGMILFHHTIAATWAVTVLCGDSVMQQILSFGGGEAEARRMLVVFPEQGTESAGLLVPFTIAYMISDLLFFPCWAKDSETALFIFHHLFSLYYWSEGLRYDCGQRYALYFIGNEITGVFLVLRWMLSQAGMKSSPLYVVNGTLFTALFIVVRVLPIPAILRSTALYFPLQEPWKIDPPTAYIRFLQVTGCLAIYLPLLLNAYWSTKVIKGYMQALKSTLRGPAKTKGS